MALQPAGLEQVARAHQDLDAVDRLDEEVAGTHLQGTAADLDVHVGGDHADRQHVRLGQPGAQRREDVEAITRGHVQVEKDEVRWLARDLFLDRVRVGDADDVLVVAGGQDLREQQQVDALVVQGEDLHLVELGVHRVFI